MQHWAGLLGTLGAVETLDYPYMKEGKPRPDPLGTLTAVHARRLHECRNTAKGPVVLIGKSMGSRVGCHVALREPVDALVCFGYPLCGAGDPTKLRDRVLRELATPVLFIQGTRDKLCPLDLLSTVRGQMTAPNDLYIVEEGDHSLLVTKRWLTSHGRTQDEVDRGILNAIQRFLAPALRYAEKANS